MSAFMHRSGWGEADTFAIRHAQSVWVLRLTAGVITSLLLSAGGCGTGSDSTSPSTQSTVAPSTMEGGPFSGDRVFDILSSSMLPTLAPGDKVAVRTGLVGRARGDIVVFRGTREETGTQVARVIGLPGEKIEAREGKVFVNDAEISESYLGAGGSTGHLQALDIPPAHYWVMGDNRVNSKDSRFFGPLDADLLEGIVTAITSPPARARQLKS